jgi:hypothetical protein
MKIDYKHARQVLEEEAEQIRTIRLNGFWVDIISRLSEECQVKNKTMIAMLGTAILAKATNLSVDVFSLQVGPDKNGKTYSARALCKEVLAANANRLGIDLGVTGREPLNNQPFFGKARVTEAMRVRSDAQASLATLVLALSELDKVKAESKARAVLRAFLQVRQRVQARIFTTEGIGEDWDIDYLTSRIIDFVNEDSEGGKRAQAIAAGLFDILYGAELVDVRRINDPSRKFPGDIGIRARNDHRTLERIIEVKDKPITFGDLTTLIDIVHNAGISKAAMLAVSGTQETIDIAASLRWAETRKIRFRVFIGWEEIVREALFWSEMPGMAVGSAVRAISQRLAFYEVTKDGLRNWLNG